MLFHLAEFTSDFDIGFQNREAPTFSSVEGKFDLSQFTVAFWMRTSDKENKGTPLSYANKRNGKVDDNALVIADYTSFDLTINNVTANLDFSTNDGEWHHVAITWSNSNGQWIAYKDGTELMRYASKLFNNSFAIYALLQTNKQILLGQKAFSAFFAKVPAKA